MSDTSLEEARRVKRVVALLLGVPVVFASGMLTVMLLYALSTGVRGPFGGGAAAKALSALVAFIFCLAGVRLLRVGAGFESARPGPADGR